MKAIVQRAYGSPEQVLSLQEVARPEPGDDDVLVRVRAASVHPDVWHVVAGVPYVLRLMGAGLTKPVHPIPGIDVAGEVEVVGKNVTQLRPGDAVFGDTVGGYQWKNGGAFAEYVVVAAEALAKKPENVTFEQAASVPTSGLIAVSNLRAGRLAAGQRVLINGAGGNVGSVAVQYAKAMGAEVTGVEHTNKLELVRSLGADHAIDYTKEDFTRSSERYDLILDVASNLSLVKCRASLTSDGIYNFIGHDHFGAATGRWLGSLPRALAGVFWAPFDRHLVGVKAALQAQQEPTLVVLRELLEAGRLAPVIDRVFPLPEAAAAMQYMIEGRAVGNIVIAA
jgi:NADPH:quinone reductase-like Zn-dependent oxidoreductase